MDRIKSLIGIVSEATKKGPVDTAVIAPYDKATLEAIREGLKHKLIHPSLYGEKERIETLVQESQISLDAVKIYDCKAPIQPAIDSIRSGENRLLMKGAITTPQLMKACLDKTNGINVGKSCCHVIVCQIPGLDRLLAVSDGGLIVLPTVEQKADIARNLIELLHSIGVAEPKIAVLASMEEVSPSIPATTDAAILTQMSRRGQIKGGIVDGPLALDNIISETAAKKKGIVSEVAGNADAIIVPNIETGNALGKSLGYFADSINSGIVLGAAVPIILPSRASKPEAKWGSLALGVLLSSN